MKTVQLIDPEILARCKEVFFRQSFVNDYMTCPMMSLYRWIMNLDGSAPFMAGLYGTAGHEVISHFHMHNQWKHTDPELLALFRMYFEKEMNKLRATDMPLPNVGKQFKSLDEQIQCHANEYMEMLQGYASRGANREFRATINEQRFVLEICHKEVPATGRLDGKPDQPTVLLFTGTIDQAGFYPDGRFALRDIKFRDNTYRPNGIKINLNKQLLLYSYGLKHGVPTCKECHPRYAEETWGEVEVDFLQERHTENKIQRPAVIYNGPCLHCKQKVGTSDWPRLFPDVSQIIWMRDYIKYKKDQYAKTIKDPKKGKEINPSSGRLVIKNIPNPKYEEGYKTGDYKGPGLITSETTEEQCENLVQDVFTIARQIQQGVFWRNEGDHCISWCKHRDHCINHVENSLHDPQLRNTEGQEPESFAKKFGWSSLDAMLGD